MSFYLGSKKRDLSDKSGNGEDSQKQTGQNYQIMFLVTVSVHQNVLKY